MLRAAGGSRGGASATLDRPLIGTRFGRELGTRSRTASSAPPVLGRRGTGSGRTPRTVASRYGSWGLACQAKCIDTPLPIPLTHTTTTPPATPSTVTTATPPPATATAATAITVTAHTAILATHSTSHNNNWPSGEIACVQR